MSTSTPSATEQTTTLTIPFALKDERPRVSHYHEVKVDGESAVEGRYPGAILVLANDVLKALGADSLTDITVTVQATKHEGNMAIDPKPEPKVEDTPKADAPKDDNGTMTVPDGTPEGTPVAKGTVQADEAKPKGKQGNK